MRYNATTGGKIDTRGAGKLEIEGIAFTDTASDGSPFVFISNTVAHFHNNQFYGNCADATKQDVFVLGGTSTISNGSATDPFQGYGTVIRDNQADCIGRFALLQTFANAINIESNHIFISSGNPAQAAIEINPTADPAVGNYIAGNLIEVLGYKYGISLVQNARNNYIGGNSCFDHGTPTVACINVNYAVGNFGNQIIDNNADSAIPPISGVGSALGISVAPNQCGVHGTNGTADICLVGFAPFGNQISIDGGANGTGFGGKITSYNGITTVGNGVASEVAAVDLTARNAAIPLTNLYSVPATGGGMYQVCWVAAVTRSAGTSSVLGGTDGFEIRYIDGDTANTVTSPAAGAPTAGGDRAYSQTNAGNATNSNISGCTVAWVQASTTIQYAMDYTSIGMPAMQYNLHIKVLAM